MSRGAWCVVRGAWRVARGAWCGSLVLNERPVSVGRRRAVMQKPNVLFILIDDMGWRDLACYGSEFYESPNIDALCAQGKIGRAHV